MVSYVTIAYGAHCGHTRSAVVPIYLRAILAIWVQRERGGTSHYVVICIYNIQCKIC
jgi:hypothetical protein